MFMAQNVQVKALTWLDNRNEFKWKDFKGQLAEPRVFRTLHRDLSVLGGSARHP